MKRTIVTPLLLAMALLAVAGTAPLAAEEAPPKEAPAETPDDNDHIEVQHVLIAFKGSLPGKEVTRTVEEAKALAAQVLERAKKGEDFGELVKEYSSDDFPGIYRLANTEVEKGPGEYSRSGMVQSFGDVAFSLAVGAVGMADYDYRKSPYGWHIIKRLK